jgi:hypothetical protein
MSQSTPTDPPEGTEPPEGDESGGATEYDELPADHPLVRTLAKQRAELKDLKKNNSSTSKELEEFRQSQLTENERVIEKTKVETRQSVRVEFAGKLVEAELKNALKGRSIPGDAVLGFNRDSFIDSDGDVDSDAISTWVEAHSTKSEAPNLDLGQGARGKGTSKPQIRSRDELSNMSASEILEARNDGRLDTLMGQS